MKGGEDGRLNVGEKPRQACCQEVWQQAERATTLRAIPAGDPHSGGFCARVAAVPNQPAAARWVQRAASQARPAPLLAGDVGIDG